MGTIPCPPSTTLKENVVLRLFVLLLTLLFSDASFAEGDVSRKDSVRATLPGMELSKTELASLLRTLEDASLSQHQAAEDHLLSLRPKPFCESWVKDVFGNTTHPGGNRNGALRERNWGFIHNCYLNRYETVFLFGGALINSQDRTATLWGIGGNIPLLDLKHEEFGVRVRFDVGVKISYLEYELGSYRNAGQVVRGLLPIPHQRLTLYFDDPKFLVRLGVTEHYLIKGIRIRSLQVQWVAITW